MPAFSYKEMFVPYILDGSKRQTVRARRKHAPRKGQIAYNFSGMRTKHCKKLNEGTIRDVVGIVINEANGIILYNGPLDLIQLEVAKQDPFHPSLPNRIVLSDIDQNVFAWDDGFRDKFIPCSFKGSYDQMIAFWKETHQLPFSGDVIYFQPYTEPADGAFCD